VDEELLLVIFIVGLALTFDFINGFHDAANSVATVVSTRVLSPGQAVIWAAFFNFIAAFGLGVHVANTIGQGIIDTGIVDEQLIISALVGAIVWDLFTWWVGLPTSSSHALIGGLVGAAVAADGWDAVVTSGLERTSAFIVISPVVGFIAAVLLMIAVLRLYARVAPAIAEGVFRRLQLLSAAAYSLAHGTNDAQKTMGVIAVLLFTTGYLEGDFYVPLWVVLSAHAAIAAGTLFGGWRIVRTMGLRITKLEPHDGFAAESAAAGAILFASQVGVPVSTTQTISGGIIGAGSTKRLSAVRWGVAFNIVIAWVVTIPAAAIVAGATFWMIDRVVS
jgi:PiT family inorganic phosphate transporter